jgi:hypothetical protein
MNSNRIWRVRRDPDMLARFLREPERLLRATAEEWDVIVPHARKAGLLARIADTIENLGGLAAIDERVRSHLISACNLVNKHERDVRFEVDRLAELLQPTFGKIILLKGAAYLMAELPPAKGRMFSDIDVLIPHRTIADVEAILTFGGWRLGDIDPYDEQYYRRWMHQLPPLVNSARESTLDVHHTIVPTTARIALNADVLLDAAVSIPGRPELAVLAPADMVLHSAVHLFNEGEFVRGLRDLDDLNLLMRHFGRETSFWEKLLSRAADLDLMRPLSYAVRYAARLLGTPIPPDILRIVSRAGPAPPLKRLMDELFLRAIRPAHPDCHDRCTASALWLLYARAHYLRMPFRLLVPHLTRKALRRRLDPVRAAQP